MKKSILLITALLFVVELLFSCATANKLEDYKPNSPKEQEVFQVLQKMVEARQNQDFEAYMALFHSDAKIFKRQHPGSNNGSFISKQQYVKSPGEDFGILPMLTDLKITFGEDIAILRCWDQYRGLRSLWTLDMEKEKGEWRVIKYEYTPYRKRVEVYTEQKRSN